MKVQKKKVSWHTAAQLAISAYNQVTPATIKKSFHNAVDFPPTQSFQQLDIAEDIQREKFHCTLPAAAVKHTKPSTKPKKTATRKSSRIASMLADPCYNDYILALSFIDNLDEFELTKREYYNAANP